VDEYCAPQGEPTDLAPAFSQAAEATRRGTSLPLWILVQARESSSIAGVGIAGMKERVRGLGGAFQIESNSRKTLVSRDASTSHRSKCSDRLNRETRLEHALPDRECRARAVWLCSSF